MLCIPCGVYHHINQHLHKDLWFKGEHWFRAGIKALGPILIEG